MFTYINWIIYSFLVILSACILLPIYKKYLFILYDKFKFLFNKLIFHKKNKQIDIIDKVEILKDHYGIKSTEKTSVNLNLLVNKPSHLNVNNIDNMNIKFLNENLKNLSNDHNSEKIIESYIYNKQIYNYLFTDNNGNIKITDLKSFYELHKKYFTEKIDNKYNILLKFYNDNHTYLYIFVKNNNLIKIKKYEEYDKICELVENNNNIFLIKYKKNIKNNTNENYITHSGYINCSITKQEIKNTFFHNSNSDNKNYKILTDFKNIKIFFYVSTKINFN